MKTHLAWHKGFKPVPLWVQVCLLFVEEKVLIGRRHMTVFQDFMGVRYMKEVLK